MPAPDDDLRATAEDLAADAGRLEQIEKQKTKLRPDDPRMTELSAEGEKIARAILPKTVAQRELAEEVQGPGS